MLRAGVNVVSLFAIVADLMRDWRNAPGAVKLYPWLDKYYPVRLPLYLLFCSSLANNIKKVYGLMARAHTAAIRNGTITEAAEALPN